MPHLIVEYGSNTGLPAAPLLNALHDTLLASGQFEASHIKVRARAYDDHLTGGSPDAGFVHLTLFLLDGRSEAVKQSLAQSLCRTVLQFAEGASPVPLQLTADVRDMARACYAKIETQPE